MLNAFCVVFRQEKLFAFAFPTGSIPSGNAFNSGEVNQINHDDKTVLLCIFDRLSDSYSGKTKLYISSQPISSELLQIQLNEDNKSSDRPDEEVQNHPKHTEKEKKQNNTNKSVTGANIKSEWVLIYLLHENIFSRSKLIEETYRQRKNSFCISQILGKKLLVCQDKNDGYLIYINQIFSAISIR
ncbi:MAG: hypothetical protein WBA93_08605 [Microcoleaceae cyanobacterium]